MSRLLRAMLVTLLTLAVFAAPANAAPDEDFVVGTGTIEIPNPLHPWITLPIDISVDAHSDASGGNPTGTLVVGVFDSVLFSGPVTCLAVEGNTAIVVIDDVSGGPIAFEIVDNSATGTPDTFGLGDSGPTGCSLTDSPDSEPLASGDFVVHDALPLTAKDQCKHGGWRDFTDNDGRPLESQGECIAFVLRTLA